MTPSLRKIIEQKLKASKDTLSFNPVGGGSINETGKLVSSKQVYFYKFNNASKFPHLFQKEAKALNHIAVHHVVRTPEVLHCIETTSKQVLILEWIESGAKTHQFWKIFGCQLAALHSISNSHSGWEEDNYMGGVHQSNQWSEDWLSFFAIRRLQPIAQQCLQKGLLNSKHLVQIDKLCKCLDRYFEPEPPALLHGDLWNGNLMCTELDEPVLIDPAIYFGHRSMDLAMTTLFGGFDKSFYEAYNYHFPLPRNYQQQWEICNLYPLFIHLLLFGSSYRPQIEQTLSKFST